MFWKSKLPVYAMKITWFNTSKYMFWLSKLHFIIMKITCIDFYIQCTQFPIDKCVLVIHNLNLCLSYYLFKNCLTRSLICILCILRLSSYVIVRLSIVRLSLCVSNYSSLCISLKKQCAFNVYVYKVLYSFFCARRSDGMHIEYKHSMMAFTHG